MRDRARDLNLPRSELLSELVSSSAAIETTSTSMARFQQWWNEQRDRSSFAIEQIPFADLDQWDFDRRGWIVHASGKYFSVRGIDVRTSAGAKPGWSQPIIVQPEIGILGILAQRRDGVLHFLLQGKMEPGNINGLQLSPTVQATRSNYTRVHGGTLPPYLEWFTDLRPEAVIVDQLQSEQGARFFRKRNRNVIVRVDDDVDLPVLENFTWVTLGQIRRLLREDNVVNMNTRSVLASVQPGGDSVRHDPLELPATVGGTDWGQLDEDLLQSLLPGPEFASDEAIISWFTGLKAKTDLDVTFCALQELGEWHVGSHTISHVDGKYFDVIAVRAAVSQREVLEWTQPMIQQREPGIVGFLIKKIHGSYHLLVQAKMEVGNFDVLEMAPTVQCLTGSYIHPEYPVAFLDEFLSPTAAVRFDTMLSEEGGRFFRESNRYMIVEVAEDTPTALPPQFMWMTFRQAKSFIKFNNYFNVEARSLLSCISPL